VAWRGSQAASSAMGSFDRSVFAKNCRRVLSAEVARLFMAEVYAPWRQEG